MLKLPKCLSGTEWILIFPKSQSPSSRVSLSAAFLLQSRNRALVAASASAKSSPTTRKPIANLDATTYRPSHLRPGAGPLALVEHDSDFSALHRRADDYTPAAEQLLAKPDQKHHGRQQPQHDHLHQQQYHQENYPQTLQSGEFLYQQQFDPQYTAIPVNQNQHIYQQAQQNLELFHEIPSQNRSPLLKRISYYQQQVEENEKLRQQSELLRQQSEQLKKQLAEAFKKADESTQQKHTSNERDQNLKIKKNQSQPETDLSYQFQESISPVEPQTYEEDLVSDRYGQWEPSPYQYGLFAQTRGLRASKSDSDDLDLVGESGSQWAAEKRSMNGCANDVLHDRVSIAKSFLKLLRINHRHLSPFIHIRTIWLFSHRITPTHSCP